MEIALKLKYTRICRKRGVRDGLVNYSDWDNSGGEYFEEYDGFAG